MTFLLILFFSKTILLTPEFIDVDTNMSGFEMSLSEPVSAITQGASIQIDVSEMLMKDGENNIIEIRNRVRNHFPENSVEVELIGEQVEINLTYQGGVSTNKDSVRLVFSNNEMPTGVDFNRIVIKTNVGLSRVKIYWRNYTM